MELLSGNNFAEHIYQNLFVICQCYISLKYDTSGSPLAVIISIIIVIATIATVVAAVVFFSVRRKTLKK